MSKPGWCSICFGEFPWPNSRRSIASGTHVYTRFSSSSVRPRERETPIIILGLWDANDEDTAVCSSCLRNACLNHPRDIISSDATTAEGLRYFGPSGTSDRIVPLRVATSVLDPSEYMNFSMIYDHIRAAPGTSKILCCSLCGKNTRFDHSQLGRGKHVTCSWCSGVFCSECTLQQSHVHPRQQQPQREEEEEEEHDDRDIMRKGAKRTRAGREVIKRRDRIEADRSGAAAELCERCVVAHQAAAMPCVQSIPGNQTSILRWNGGEQLRGLVVEPYNRYIRLLLRHRTRAIQACAEDSELSMCLTEAAYCYPASAVPVDALARHLIRVVTSPAGEVFSPLSDVPILKTSACNAIEQNGVSVCYVCQACTTPGGDPFPQEHWAVCPRFDAELETRSVSLYGKVTTETMIKTRKRHATYSALRSVPMDTRRACLHMLARACSLRRSTALSNELFVNEGERKSWVKESPSTMPNFEELARMDAHEAAELVRLVSTCMPCPHPIDEGAFCSSSPSKIKKKRTRLLKAGADRRKEGEMPHVLSREAVGIESPSN